MKFLNKELIDIFHRRLLKELSFRNIITSEIMSAIRMVDSKTNPPVNFQGICIGSAYSDEDCAVGRGPIASRIREHFEVLFNSGVIKPNFRIDFEQEFEYFFDYCFLDHSSENKTLGLIEKKQLLRCFIRWWQRTNLNSIEKRLQFKVDTTFGRAHKRESTVEVQLDEWLKIRLEHQGECRSIQIENKQPQIENQVHDLVFEYIKDTTSYDLNANYEASIEEYKNQIDELVRKIDWAICTSGFSNTNNSQIHRLINIGGNDNPYVTCSISNGSNYPQDEKYGLSFIIKDPIQEPVLTVSKLSAPSYIPKQFVSFMTYIHHKEFHMYLENLLAEQQKVEEDDGTEGEPS